jgi:glutamate dehydrogenase/leucine dehydrogenase
MVQNLNMDHWDEEEIYKRLKKRMLEAYHEVYQTAMTNNISLRKAAYTIAVRNVVETMKARGWI